MRERNEDIAEIFKALGDPTRLRIIALLSSKRKMFCVCDLAHKIGVTQPAVSQHLRILKQVGILRGHRHGCHIHYRFNHSALRRHKDVIDRLFKIVFECCREEESKGHCRAERHRKGGD